jgi:hypothetical protein
MHSSLRHTAIAGRRHARRRAIVEPGSYLSRTHGLPNMRAVVVTEGKGGSNLYE